MINCLRRKPGVRLDGLEPGGFAILSALEQTARAVEIDLTISCGTDGHSPSDPHTLGNALDVRTIDLTPALVLAVLQSIDTLLDGQLFFWQYECPQVPDDPGLRAVAVVSHQATAPHVHVQVRRGQHYPPAAVPVPPTPDLISA